MNLKLLYSEKDIAKRVKELGSQITKAYEGMGRLLCVCVLKGAAVFFADLIRKIELDDIVIDFITLSSYGQGRTSLGEVQMLDSLSVSPENMHVLVVEDIVDSGLTLSFLSGYLHSKGAASVRTAALLDKPSARKADVSPDYAAFTLLSDEFVVGYGLDLNQRHRAKNGIYQIN